MSSDKLKSVRVQGLDKFYTNPDYAKHCINVLDEKYKLEYFDYIIEPSAGSGSFYNNITHINKIGLDIEPESPDILSLDYFNFNPDEMINGYKNVLTIGNPPFGRVSSQAVRFFNKSAEFSNVIAFIIPRTFRKISIQNKLNLNFHLVHDEETPQSPCVFSPKMSVKCCFQIWVRKEVQREIINLSICHPDWEFIQFGPKDENNQPTPPLKSDFALRAYGGRIGEIKKNNLDKLRPKSYHWIKSNIDIDVLITRFNSLDFSKSKDTARQNSTGKAELVKLYSDMFDSEFK